MRLVASLCVLAVLVSACAGGDPGTGDGSTTTTTLGGVEGPVFVDFTDILYLESFPVQVRLVVRGSLPTPCHQVQWAVGDASDALDVELWSVVALGQDCAQVLEPFEVSIPLGSYEVADVPVSLNGEQVGRIFIGDAAVSGSSSLVGGGWSFGMCLGYCNADLVVDGDKLILTGRNRELEEPLFVNRGSLTAIGQERLATALQALGAEPLDSVFGCPDCADGGAAYLGLDRDGVSSRHDMEFGSPPEMLAELHGIAMGMIDALETCESDEVIAVDNDCQAWEGFEL